MIKNGSLLKQRREYVQNRIGNVSNNLRSREVEKVAKELFLSKVTIYNDLNQV